MKRNIILFCLLGLILASCTNAFPPQEEVCEPGYYYHYTDKACTKIVECEPGYNYHYTDKVCTKTVTVECEPDYYYDNRNKVCVKMVECEPGYAWRPEGCLKLPARPLENLPANVPPEVRKLRQQTATAESVKQNTTISYDDFKKEYTITGPVRPSADGTYFYVLGAFYSNNKIGFILAVYQIRSDEMGPAYFHEAYDSSGKKFNTVITRDTFTSPSRLEMGKSVGGAAIIPPKDYLESSQDNGIKLKFYGKHDNLVVNVEGFYIKGFLEKLEEHLNEKKPSN